MTASRHTRYFYYMYWRSYWWFLRRQLGYDIKFPSSGRASVDRQGKELNSAYNPSWQIRDIKTKKRPWWIKLMTGGDDETFVSDSWDLTFSTLIFQSQEAKTNSSYLKLNVLHLWTEESTSRFTCFCWFLDSSFYWGVSSLLMVFSVPLGCNF